MQNKMIKNLFYKYHVRIQNNIVYDNMMVIIYINGLNGVDHPSIKNALYVNENNNNKNKCSLRISCILLKNFFL